MQAQGVSPDVQSTIPAGTQSDAHLLKQSIASDLGPLSAFASGATSTESAATWQPTIKVPTSPQVSDQVSVQATQDAKVAKLDSSAQSVLSSTPSASRHESASTRTTAGISARAVQSLTVSNVATAVSSVAPLQAPVISGTETVNSNVQPTASKNHLSWESATTVQPGSQSQTQILSSDTATASGSDLVTSYAAAGAAALQSSSSGQPMTASTVATTQTGNGRLAGSGSVRSSHAASKTESTATQAVAGSGGATSGVTSHDASALVRDPAVGRGTSDGNRESTGTTARSVSAATRDALASLDAGTDTVTPTWVHAGAQRAEVGYNDPVLGWVGVRADSSGGSVHASVVPGSAEAAQALGGHLDGLNAFLAEHHSSVDSVTLASPESRSAASGMEQTGSQTMQQGAGQGSSQGSSQGSGQSSFGDQQSYTPVSQFASGGLPADMGPSDAHAQPVSAGGVHISVMA